MMILMLNLIKIIKFIIKTFKTLNKVHVGKHFIEFRVILFYGEVVDVRHDNVESISSEDFKSSEFFVDGM